jgi:Fe(3+) dicitrate transport protein
MKPKNLNPISTKPMKNLIKFLMILLILPAYALSEVESSPMTTGSLTGKILDEKQQPLFNVNVGFIGTSLGSATNEEGIFVIDGVPSGLFVLGASMVGYEDIRQEVLIRPGNLNRVHLVMPERIYSMPQVSIIAQKKGIFESVPGSLTYIDQQQIEQLNPMSGNEIIRRSPGVHVVDEEGLGLRVNIGIRGLDPDRSRSVLVMEDGIPVALNPYGEPEMYYTPAMDRMAGVEILKGSGSILHGPQTIGGVVNYITPDPPLSSKGNISMRGAQGGFFSGLFSYGNTYEKTGFNVSYLRKQADSIGTNNFTVNDLTAKLRFQMSKQASLAVKLGVYDEISNATYVGITQTMYEAGGIFDFARIAPDDRLSIRRYSLGLIHNFFFSNNTRLSTTAYAYTTTRNWQRQDFAYNSFDAQGNLNPKPSNFTGVTWGNEQVSQGAIYMRNSTGNRNRQFEVAGIESRLQSEWMLGSAKNHLTAGGRLLFERANEQRVNGTTASASSGNLQEDEIRSGIGYSAFVHNQTQLGQRFSFTLGTRLEYYDYERDIRRGRFVINGQTLTRDTMLLASSHVASVIPGAGMNYLLGSASTLFAGIHRGFAPPRVKDAISNQGFVYELDAEKSWNYELGIRQKTAWGIDWELTGFYMDFSNQIIPVSQSSGGTGAGLVNGGSTVHRGFEFALLAELSQWWNSPNYAIKWDAGITRVDAFFNADRLAGSAGNQVNIKGNKTPYAPEWFVNTSLVFEHNNGLMFRLTANHVGEQFTDILNTEAASNDGRIGKLAPYRVFDASLCYRLAKWNSTFSISAKNLTDERYIVTRRPQGIRLGMPRIVTAGIKVDF